MIPPMPGGTRSAVDLARWFAAGNHLDSCRRDGDTGCTCVVWVDATSHLRRDADGRVVFSANKEPD
jgi:hypothetical protein